MPPKAKRPYNDLLTYFDTSALSKLVFTQEIQVNSLLRAELSSCVVPLPEQVQLLGYEALQPVVIPQTAFASVKYLPGQVVLLFPPNCKFNEITTQQLVPGINSKISDNVSEVTYYQLVTGLRVNMFKQLFMQLYKSYYIWKGRPSVSQGQYQTLVSLNLINNFDASMLDVLPDLFKDYKTGFKNYLNFDAKAGHFTGTVLVGEKMLTMQAVNYKVGGSDYFYLNYTKELTANDGYKYQMQFSYCNILNQVADALDMDILDVLNSASKKYLRSIEPREESVINLLYRSYVCMAKLSGFRKLLSARFLSFFRQLMKKGLLACDVAEFVATQEEPQPAQEEVQVAENKAQPTKEKSKSPARGAKGIEHPVVLPPDNTALFDEEKTPHTNAYSMEDKLHVLQGNIELLVYNVPDEIMLPILDFQCYEGREYLKMNVYDEVLAAVLNTEEKVDFNEYTERVYNLFRDLSQEFGVRMPGYMSVRYKDYAKPEKVKPKYDFMEGGDDSVCNQSDEDAEKRARAVKPVLYLPQLRNFKYDPTVPETSKVEGVGVLEQTTSMAYSQRLQSGAFVQRRRKHDYEPVWAAVGMDDDLYEEERAEATTCYVDCECIEEHVEYYVTYAPSDENKKVAFKQNTQVAPGAKAQQTVIQQQTADRTLLENCCFQYKPVIDKVQPSPLYRHFQAQITPNCRYYMVKLDGQQFDVDNTVLNFQSEYAGRASSQRTRLTFFFVDYAGRWKSHQLEFASSTSFKFTQIHDTVDYTQEMVLCQEFLTDTGATYPDGGRTTVIGHNHVRNFSYTIYIDPITAQQNSFYRSVASKTLIMPENRHMVSIIYQVTLSTEHCSPSPIYFYLELGEPVSTVTFSAQVMYKHVHANSETVIYENRTSKPLYVTVPDGVDSFYILVKYNSAKNTPPINCKLHCISDSQCVDQIVYLNYNEAYCTSVSVLENNRTGYIMYQLKDTPVIAQFFFTADDRHDEPAKTKDTVPGGGQHGYTTAQSQIEQREEAPLDTSYIEITMFYLKVVYYAAQQKNKPPYPPSGKQQAKGGKESEYLQVDSYIDMMAPKISEESADIPILAKNTLSDGLFYIFNGFCQEDNYEIDLQFTGVGPLSIVFYSAQDSGLSLTNFNITQVIMNQISQKLYSKDYITTADTVRKQLGTVVRTATSTVDVSKLQTAPASLLQLLAGQDQKGAKKGQMDVQRPDQTMQQLLLQHRPMSFDGALEESVIGVVEADKKKGGAAAKPAKGQTRGFLAGLLEDCVRDTDVNREECAGRVVVSGAPE